MRPLRPESIFGTPDGRALVGQSGEVLGSVPSTLDVARRRLLDGAPDGYVVLAEHQSAGRGRTGAWECPPGLGLLMSVVLRIALPVEKQRLAVLLGAVATTEAIRELGVPAHIKWPNDIVVTPAQASRLIVRKLGGVLVEQARPDDAAAHLVLGIGLNVNQGRDDLPADAVPAATSLRLEKGEALNRAVLCRALLRHLSEWYRRLRMGQSERILARWRGLSCLLHRRVRARVEGRLLAGTVIGLRSSGELILEADNGGRLLLSDERARLLC
jgi:BirA family biotin operon repressor/biotin-[acetyl-CoA-carboxylase] ligase